MTRKKRTRIKYGDPRVFFETTATKPFVGPSGIEYDTGAVVRGSAFIDVDGKNASISLPSMAELIYFQADKDLKKASKIKSSAMRLERANGNYHIADEELFYIYMQLCSLGILGLYSSLESMVYELYIRKNKENGVVIDGLSQNFKQFTNFGFDRKLTTVAAQLSEKKNIYGTELHNYALEIKKLRTIIQHWDVERRDDYFINLPGNHPLKVFVFINPSTLSDNARAILDHYSLKN